MLNWTNFKNIVLKIVFHTNPYMFIRELSALHVLCFLKMSTLYVFIQPTNLFRDIQYSSTYIPESVIELLFLAGDGNSIGRESG